MNDITSHHIISHRCYSHRTVSRISDVIAAVVEAYDAVQR